MEYLLAYFIIGLLIYIWFYEIRYPERIREVYQENDSLEYIPYYVFKIAFIFGVTILWLPVISICIIQNF